MYSPDGTLSAKWSLPGEHFLNDFAMTKNAVYITDSATSTIYRASLPATDQENSSRSSTQPCSAPTPSLGPTTPARDGGRLLWVLGQLSDETPDMPYVVSQVPTG